MEPKIFSFFSFFGFFSFSENFQFPDSRAAGRRKPEDSALCIGDLETLHSALEIWRLCTLHWRSGDSAFCIGDLETLHSGAESVQSVKSAVQSAESPGV